MADTALAENEGDSDIVLTNFVDVDTGRGFWFPFAGEAR